MRIDVGLANFAMCSDGQVIANPRFLRTEERPLARVQRQHAQLATGIRQRRKQHKAVARVHERITFRRHLELL